MLTVIPTDTLPGLARRVFSMPISALNQAKLQGMTTMPDVKGAIMLSIANSDWSNVVLDEQGAIVLIYGFKARPASGDGCPWLVMSAHARRYARDIAELAPRAMDEMKKMGVPLSNVVDRRDTGLIRLLRRMGFKAYGMTAQGRHLILTYLPVRAGYKATVDIRA